MVNDPAVVFADESTGNLDTATGSEELQMVTGRIAAEGQDELAIPDSWVTDLGFGSPQEAVGATVQIVMTNRAGQQQEFDARVPGVTQASLAGVATGTYLTRTLAEGFLAGLPGLSLFTFQAPKIALIVTCVMAIAFRAGAIPALRAARKDPITALRHE